MIENSMENISTRIYKEYKGAYVKKGLDLYYLDEQTLLMISIIKEKGERIDPKDINEELYNTISKLIDLDILKNDIFSIEEREKL